MGVAASSDGPGAKARASNGGASGGVVKFEGASGISASSSTHGRDRGSGGRTRCVGAGKRAARGRADRAGGAARAAAGKAAPRGPEAADTRSASHRGRSDRDLSEATREATTMRWSLRRVTFAVRSVAGATGESRGGVCEEGTGREIKGREGLGAAKAPGRE